MSDQRILVLATDAFGGYGGIAQYNRDFITAMAASDAVDSICVLPRGAPRALPPLPPKVRELGAVAGRVAYAAATFRAVWQFKPTIIFCGHLYHTGLARLAARMAGAKLIVQLHGTEMWRDISPSLRRSMEAADLVLVVSRDTRARVRTRTLIDHSKIVVLNNTVGEEFTPGDRIAARSRFSLGDELAILTVSRLDAKSGYKGHDRIIALIAKLRDAGSPVVYLIAGEGPYQQTLEAMAERHGVHAHVRFLGHVPRDDQPDLYRAADLFALPSTGEGFGIVFLEAMACGTPAIGLAVGGAPDALGDGELGTCVAPEDFADAFIAMTNTVHDRDPDLPVRVRDRFGMPLFCAQVDRIIREQSTGSNGTSAGTGA